MTIDDGGTITAAPPSSRYIAIEGGSFFDAMVRFDFRTLTRFDHSISLFSGELQLWSERASAR
jgi:hypothetical protein